MLGVHHYHSLQQGTHLLILGAIHGNETCGTVALKRLIAAIESQNILLKQGQLTLVPISNPKAYAENKRFIDRNLNRSLYIKTQKQAYEDYIDPILCPLLQQADFVLDIHSYETAGQEFGFLGHNTQRELEFCLNLGVEKFVYGWSEAFAQANHDPYASMETTEYARQFNIPAVTIECGQHLNADAPDIAYRTILKALQYLDMIDKEDIAPLNNHQFTKMQTVFYKQKSGRLTKNFKHYDDIMQGEVIAIYDDGEQIIAEHDCVMILPKHHATNGAGWFYLGIKTPCPAILNQI